MEDITIDLAEGFENNDVYDVFSHLAQETINVTAKGLLEIAAWVEEHRAQLEEQQVQSHNEAEEEDDDDEDVTELNKKLGIDVRDHQQLLEYWQRSMDDLKRQPL